jgi:hypothetical protein
MVHMKDKDILFKKCSKMHMAEFVEYTALATQVYTKGEVA